MMREPPSDDWAANVNTPDTVAVREPDWVITWSLDPTPRFLSLASFWMMPTSPDLAGGAPATNVLGCSFSWPGEYEKNSVGEPPVPTTLPSTATAPALAM